ncbi:MAG: ThiF family adenylyltransferase [Candidatus Heimdallarchaeota archaeon]|nr:ThiF family adenylyltransferase [Candidatus Heimdallarchaeota archaeon]
MSGRYHRQQLIDKWDQEKVTESTVAIIGMGALGTVAAASLAMGGVGHLILVDLDTVEISNLNRQLFYRSTDVNKPKVEVSAKILEQINPDIKITPLNMPIEEVSTEILSKCNVIAAGLDTFQTRRWVNSFVVSHNIPLVSGGMYGFYGNIQVIMPKETACIECQTLIPEHELQKACTPFGEVRKAIRGEEEVDAYQPAVSSVSFVIGGLMAQEVFKIVLGLKPLSEYLFWDGDAGVFTSLALQRRENCIICSDHYQLRETIIHSPSDQTLLDFANQLRYSFNLGPNMRILYKAKEIALTSDYMNTIFQSGAIFRVVDPLLSFPAKFKVILD